MSSILLFSGIVGYAKHIRTCVWHLLTAGDSHAILCSSRKYPYSPHGGFFCFAPSLPPGNSSLASYFASKILTFKTPLPQGISDDLPWGGYGFLLELHIVCFVHSTIA